MIYQEPKQKVVKLTDLIAPSFYDLHWDIKESRHTHYKLKGGRGSTKSSVISLEMIMGIMEDSEANGIAMRKVGRFLEESVFEQLLWAIDALNVSHLWKIKLSPLGLKYLPTGQKIIFRGADDPKKIKSAKLKKGYFKYIWFEERDEFDGEEEERTILQSLMRGGNKFTVFYSWNPPKSINSWVNQDVLLERDDTLVHHSDYRTVPKDWLGEPFLIEAEHLKKVKPDAYRHEYLGEAIGTGGQVFSNAKVRRILDEEIDFFDRIRQGLDWGYAADPFAYLKMYYDKTRRRLFIYDEIYVVNMSNRKAALKVIAKNPLNMRVLADSAEPKSIAFFRDEMGINIKGAIKSPGSIDYGIKFLQDLEEIIIDGQRCPNASREFTSYELERDKNGNFKGSYPDKDNHAIDAARYGLNEDMPKKGFTKIGG